MSQVRYGNAAVQAIVSSLMVAPAALDTTVAPRSLQSAFMTSFSNPSSRAAARLPSRFGLTLRGFGPLRYLDLNLDSEQWGALLYD